ncbi:hypothetical protein [Nocardia iowensis]|uniref:Uncharacterized protein n=1 Tax=Nocardia iowensis TaxID=204891 RepID=A0ABX8S027_NOCIO|nr:hypothetical protein [Nocardia iowensis]QXN94587.1 hypothetical protein KV110_16965 [Nocardia iowensis]
MTIDSISTRRPDLSAATLDAPAADIDLMPMSDRLEFLRCLSDIHGAALGGADSWRRLEGVVQFFGNAGLGEPGSWLSRVNATVLEAVERGIAIAIDPGADDFGNPGARAWADYLALVAVTPEPNAVARAWSWARRVSVDQGKRWAQGHGVEPTPVETRFLLIADLGNFAVANRAAVDIAVTYAGLLGPSLADIDHRGIDRLFDLGDAEATRRGCEIAYAAAIIDPRATCDRQEHRLLPVLGAMLDMLAGHHS